MYQTGEYIIYGSHGVCRVEKIGPMNMSGVSKERLYYTLVPVYAKDSMLFTPVDNRKVLMRPVISREEADALIAQMDEMEPLWVKDEKRREAVYKEALRSGDPREWVRMIKTLHMRGRKRLEEGKKNTVGDERYLSMAQDSLLGEMAVALGMDREKVKEYILNHTMVETVAE